MYPKNIVKHTKFKQSKIEYKRYVGSVFINSYNDVLSLALRCNHDVQYLIGGYDACDSIYYIFKYTFKSQESIDSIAATTLATTLIVKYKLKKTNRCKCQR